MRRRRWRAQGGDSPAATAADETANLKPTPTPSLWPRRGGGAITNPAQPAAWSGLKGSPLAAVEARAPDANPSRNDPDPALPSAPSQSQKQRISRLRRMPLPNFGRPGAADGAGARA